MLLKLLQKDQLKKEQKQLVFWLVIQLGFKKFTTKWFRHSYKVARQRRKTRKYWWPEIKIVSWPNIKKSHKFRKKTQKSNSETGTNENNKESTKGIPKERCVSLEEK